MIWGALIAIAGLLGGGVLALWGKGSKKELEGKLNLADARIKELESLRLKDLAQWATENKAWEEDRARLEKVIALHKEAVQQLEADLDHSSHRDPESVRGSLNRLLQIPEAAGVPKLPGPSPSSGGPRAVPGNGTSGPSDKP